MCGISGVIVRGGSRYPAKVIKAAAKNLFALSAARGKDASGTAVIASGRFSIIKKPVRAGVFVEMPEYRDCIDDGLRAAGKSGNGRIAGPLAILNHARLATNGSQYRCDNNSPCLCGDLIGAHNGIITNSDELRDEFKINGCRGDVDSEILFKLLDLFARRPGGSLAESARRVFENIEGAASIAVYAMNIPQLLLGTNTGSLYFCGNRGKDMLLFASESVMLKALIDRLRLSISDAWEIRQLKPKSAVMVNGLDLSEEAFPLA